MVNTEIMSDMKTRILNSIARQKCEPGSRGNRTGRFLTCTKGDTALASKISPVASEKASSLKTCRGKNQGSIKNGLYPHLKLQIRRIANGNLDLFDQVRHGPDILHRVRIEAATLNDLA